ncbi:hypothetical protein LIER_41982 [Lithospermum erythrorhizon]|uniref:Uncharacterized protein n=1 Tax=Lithospermum erythrorhizon TaxID=34254 RepID=A0AAV3RKX8_LITER
MVTTRGGVNTSGKETKVKKKAEESSDDACRVVEPPVVEVEAQNVKLRKLKTKGKWLKAPVSTKNKGGENLVFNPTPIRNIPPVDTTLEVTQEAQPLIHNFHLPWVDYSNVRELINPKPRNLSSKDDDIGGDGSHDEIPTMQDGIVETIAPIVEGRVGDSSCVDAADLSEYTAVPSAADSMGKTAKPSNISINIGDVGRGVDNPKGGSKTAKPSCIIFF